MRCCRATQHSLVTRQRGSDENRHHDTVTVPRHPANYTASIAAQTLTPFGFEIFDPSPRIFQDDWLSAPRPISAQQSSSRITSRLATTETALALGQRYCSTHLRLCRLRGGTRTSSAVFPPSGEPRTDPRHQHQNTGRLRTQHGTTGRAPWSDYA